MSFFLGSRPPRLCNNVLVLLAITAGLAHAALSLDGSLPTGTVGQQFQSQLTATGGTPPYHFSLTGTNPPFLQVTDAGVLIGTPVASGVYTFNIKAVDSAPTPDTGSITMTFNVPAPNSAPLKINTTSIPNAVYGAEYSAPISIEGGTLPYSVGGTGLPPSLQVHGTTGTIFSYGLIADVGPHTFTYTVFDHSVPAKSVQTTFTLTVTPGLLYSGDDFPDGTVGQPYSSQTHISQGTAPFTFAIVAGTLPPGLSLNSSTGTLSGTPTRVGDYNFAVKVTDSHGLSGTATSFMSIAGAPFSVTGTLPSLGRVGEPITPVTFTITGGTPPYTFSAITGLTFDAATRTLSGTPTTGGNAGIELTVIDSAGSRGQFSGHFPVLDILPNSLPQAAAGQRYETIFGVVPSEFAVRGPAFTVSGAPPGLAMSNGHLVGTPYHRRYFQFHSERECGFPVHNHQVFFLDRDTVCAGSLASPPGCRTVGTIRGSVFLYCFRVGRNTPLHRY
ncbi:MAG: Ig domain-containing protein [Acidobacteriota bacterium]